MEEESIAFSSPSFAKLVHFDLKGAPPLISYFHQVFPILKELGATGLLLEYEDMFPYEGDLEIVCQPDVYSKEEIKQIQAIASDNDLLVIPLVQTFGHLEFLLKHSEYFELREADRYPNSVCPSHPKTMSVIMDMIDQIMDSHQSLKFIHFGADEVWHLGLCAQCKEKMKENNWSKEHLFLSHVSKLVTEFREKHPGIQVIIWDDMMRDIDVEILKSSDIGNLVQPMVWHYLTPEDFRLKPALWEKYCSVFSDIWVASAFKGATEMTQLITPPRYHVANQQAWLQTIHSLGSSVSKIQGIAITGWQRFDHFTVLCELFPVALPSLGICLQTVLEGDVTSEGLKRVSDVLGFSGLLEIDPFPRPQAVAPAPTFPGGNIYSSCLLLSNFITEYHILMHHPSIEGAFSSYHVMHNRVNTLHIDQFLPRARILLMNMESLYSQLGTELAQIFYPSTVEEFLTVNVMPFLEKLRKLVRDADQQVILNASHDKR